MKKSAYSTSTRAPSSVLTIIFATAAGASGRRSYRRSLCVSDAHTRQHLPYHQNHTSVRVEDAASLPTYILYLTTLAGTDAVAVNTGVLTFGQPIFPRFLSFSLRRDIPEEAWIALPDGQGYCIGSLI